MSKAIETFKSWAESINGDVAALKKLVESEGASLEARKIAAAGLSYLVTRMDLIPDWNEGIGALDDVMILRLCAQLASAHPLGDLPHEVEITLATLSNDADHLKTLLGFELADKLKKHAARLIDQPVRGKTPLMIVTDESDRKTLWNDLDEEIKRSLPAVVKDPADAELRLKAYLQHKLK